MGDWGRSVTYRGRGSQKHYALLLWPYTIILRKSGCQKAVAKFMFFGPPPPPVQQLFLSSGPPTEWHSAVA